MDGGRRQPGVRRRGHAGGLGGGCLEQRQGEDGSGGGDVILGMPGRASATVPHQVLAEDNQLLSDTSSRRRSRSQVGGWNHEAGTHGRHLGLKHKFGNHQHVDACKPIGTDEIMQAEGSERQLLGPALSK